MTPQAVRLAESVQSATILLIVVPALLVGAVALRISVINRGTRAVRPSAACAKKLSRTQNARTIQFAARQAMDPQTTQSLKSESRSHREGALRCPGSTEG